MVNVVYPTCNPEYSNSWPCNASIGHVLSISVVAVGEFQLLCFLRGADSLFRVSEMHKCVSVDPRLTFSVPILHVLPLLSLCTYARHVTTNF